MPKKKNLNAKNEMDTKKINEGYSEYYWIAGAILVLILVFGAAYWIFSGIGKVKYEGLTFTLEKFDKITIYHYYYLTKSPFTGELFKYNVYLRNNPAESTVNIEKKTDIFLAYDADTYIGLDDTGLNCPDTQVAISDLTKLLINNFVTPKTGALDYNKSLQYNMTHVTCEKFPDNVVIKVRGGNETKITIDKNCYDLSVANCEIQQTIEKFIVQAIVDAKARGTYSSAANGL